MVFDLKLSLREKCPYSEFLWSIFFRIGLNTERYGVSLRIQSECGKKPTEKLQIRTLFTQRFSRVLHKPLIVTLICSANGKWWNIFEISHVLLFFQEYLKTLKSWSPKTLYYIKKASFGRVSLMVYLLIFARFISKKVLEVLYKIVFLTSLINLVFVKLHAYSNDFTWKQWKNF